MTLYFECKLKSDVVLTSRSATEGFHQSLDYIPGGKFLGIVASKLYDDKTNTQQTLDLFHNGKVRFGDAHIKIKQEPSYPVPFAWYRDKLKNESKIFLHHRLTAEIRDQQRDKGLQLNQERTGYINDVATFKAEIDQHFSIKSAYNSEKRKSQDEQMYGYHALKVGLTFLFTVEIPDNRNYKQLIINALKDTKRIGRSKTAEYGLLEIKHLENPFPELSHKDSEDNILIVYANSNLCFFDKYGFPTRNITAKDLGVENGKIKWELSQVRLRKYQSYNGYRRQVNEDRVIFQKGSVFAIEKETGFQIESIPKWVGALNKEGFGKIIINPPFLISPDEAIPLPAKYESELETTNSNQENGSLDEQQLQLLQRRAALIHSDNSIEKLVEKYFKKEKKYYKNGISKSQWGAIRGIAKSAVNKDTLITLLFHKDEENPAKSLGFLRRGIAANNWNERADELKNFVGNSENSQILLIKFASKMQKYLDKNEK